MEIDRVRSLNEPANSESELQRLRHQNDRRPVRAVLRLLDEQQAVEQLDGVILVEEAVVDQSRVLVTGPAMQAGTLRLLHGVEWLRCYPGSPACVNVSGLIH